MKILFCGLGSIGHRHARLIQANYQHEIFAFRTFKGQKSSLTNIEELTTWQEVANLRPDVAFIANPTAFHIQTAQKCAEVGCNLFIEKPLGSSLVGLDDLLNIIEKKHLHSYVAYHFRFHPVIEKLKYLTETNKVLHARITCTSYLPSWRPQQNFRNSYSAQKDLGGGVILDLSHEMDYIEYLFGEIIQIEGRFGRKANLTIDAEDYADILIATPKGLVTLHINFLSHISKRLVEIDLEQFSIVADLNKGSIDEYENGKRRKRWELSFDYDDPYNKQLNYFFNNLDCQSLLMNNVSEASKLFRKLIAFKNNFCDA